MSENQNTVAQWAQETFGNSPTSLRIAIRANIEMSELLTEVADDEWLKVPTEAADVAIVMYRLADKLSINLDHGIEVLASKGRKKVDALAAVANANTVLANIQHMLSLEDRPYFYTHQPEPVSDQYRQQVQQISMLMAWLYVWLDEICILCGTNLRPEINKKMRINRKREWNVRGGEGFHK